MRRRTRIKRPSMAHTVDDEIHTHLIRVGREPERVVRILSPFPSVAQVGVPVDHDHQTALVVEDSPKLRVVSVFLPGGPSRDSLPYVRYLQELFHVVEASEHGMVARYVHDLVAGGEPLKLHNRVLPFVAAPEAVDNPEYARQEGSPE